MERDKFAGKIIIYDIKVLAFSAAAAALLRICFSLVLPFVLLPSFVVAVVVVVVLIIFIIYCGHKIFFNHLFMPGETRGKNIISENFIS